MTSFQPLNEKKTCCTGKSLGHLFYNSQVLYILCLFFRLLCHDAAFTFIFYLARPMQHLESISAKFI